MNYPLRFLWITFILLGCVVHGSGSSQNWRKVNPWNSISVFEERSLPSATVGTPSVSLEEPSLATSALQRLNLNSIKSPSPENPPLSSASFAGLTFSDFLINCSIFVDENQNGEWDEGEVMNTTDIHGNYFFSDAPNGPLILSSRPPCFDRSSGSELSGDLEAPAASSVISPLTTLLRRAMAFLSLNHTEANDLVATGLGLGSVNLSSMDGATWFENVNQIPYQRNLLVTMMQIQVLNSFGMALLYPYVKIQKSTSEYIHRAIAFSLWSLRESLENGTKDQSINITTSSNPTSNFYLDLSSSTIINQIFSLVVKEIVPDSNGTVEWADFYNTSFPQVLDSVVQATSLVNGYLEVLKPNSSTSYSFRKSNLNLLLGRNGYPPTDLNRLLFALGVVGQRNWPDAVKNLTRVDATSSRSSSPSPPSPSIRESFFTQSGLISELDSILKWNFTLFVPPFLDEPSPENNPEPEFPRDRFKNSKQRFWVAVVLGIVSFVLLFVFLISMALVYLKYSRGREELSKGIDFQNKFSTDDFSSDGDVEERFHSKPKLMSNSSFLSSNIPVYEARNILNSHTSLVSEPKKKSMFNFSSSLLPTSLAFSRAMSSRSKASGFLNLNASASFSRSSKPPSSSKSRSGEMSNTDSTYFSFPNLPEMFPNSGLDADLYPTPPHRKEFGMSADPFPNETYPQYFVRTDAKSSYGSEEERLLENTITRWLFGESMWQNLERNSQNSEDVEEDGGRDSPRAPSLDRLRATFRTRTTFKRKIEQMKQEDEERNEKKEKHVETFIDANPMHQSSIQNSARIENESQQHESTGSKYPESSRVGVSLERSKQFAEQEPEGSIHDPYGDSSSSNPDDDDYVAFKAKLLNRMNLNPCMVKRIEEGSEDSSNSESKLDGMIWKQVRKQLYQPISQGGVIFKSTWP